MTRTTSFDNAYALTNRNDSGCRHHTPGKLQIIVFEKQYNRQLAQKEFEMIAGRHYYQTRR